VDSAELRLRLVEALTRTDGSMARNNTSGFTQVIAQIETFVLQDTSATEPAAAAETDKPKSPRQSKKTDKDAPDFLE
jgi:hypothetical protein